MLKRRNHDADFQGAGRAAEPASRRKPDQPLPINSPMLPDLTLDAGGELTILIQNDRPDDASANWLPAPYGPLMIALRF